MWNDDSKKRTNHFTADPKLGSLWGTGGGLFVLVTFAMGCEGNCEVEGGMDAGR